MAVTRWGFESGAHNDTLSSANSSATTVITTGGTAIISTGQSYEGTRSALITATAASGSVYISKDISDTTQLGIDSFVYITELPSAETSIMWVGNGTTRCFSLALTADGKIRIRDGAGGGGGVAWTATSNISLNTWYRISIFATQGTSDGTIQAAYFAGSSTTPTETSTLLTTQNTGASPYNRFRIGAKTSTGTTTMTAYFDNYGYDLAATGLIPIASAPSIDITNSMPVAFIDASSSTGSSLTYDIAQVSGPSKTPINIANGKWAIPIDSEDNTVWTVTITQTDDQTDSENVTIVSQSGQSPVVELLYATGPGTFV